ncbi:SLBB domain-containing protein, partial [Caminibacter sp.]
PFIPMKEVKKLAIPNEDATLIIVYHWNKNGEMTTKKLNINNDTYIVLNGDEVNFISDFNAKEIHITLQGAVIGKHNLIVKKGTSLADVLKQIPYSPLANKSAIQLYRKSIAKLQKELIDAQLKDLEAKVLTASSVTTGGATIRKEEAQLILDFIKRARQIKPKGRVVLNKDTNLSNVILEDGDTIYIPKKSNIVTIQGEVKIPGAQTYVPNYTVKDYIKSVGGFSSRADREHVLIIRQSGKVITYDATSWFGKSPKIKPGDSILVLGKPSSENLQITKDITQILYQIAVSAGVVLRLF